MRRAIPAIILTLIGLGALAAFKSSPGVPASTATVTTIGGDASGTGTTAPPAGASPPSTTSGTTSGSTTPSTRGTTGGTAHTVDGDPFDNRYGTVQVRVTFNGSAIAD